MSFPAALVAYLLGAWRLAILSFYFGVFAWFAVPVSEAVDIRLDYLLASLFVFGCILGVALYASYRRVQSAT